MNMTPVASTNVRSVGYDRVAATMRIEFQNGGVYDYYGVSTELAERMLRPNPWHLLGRRSESTVAAASAEPELTNVSPSKRRSGY